MRFTSLFALSAVVLCFACEEKPAPAPKVEAKPQPAPVVAKKEEAVKPLEGQALADLYTSCWKSYSEGAWDKFGSCYAEDATSTFLDSGQPELKGRDAVLANIKQERPAFPDISGTPEIVLVNGRQIATIGFISGTNKGEMKTPDGKTSPATNKPMAQHIFHAVTFNDKNQVSKETLAQDLGTVMGQLGQAGDAKVRAADGKAMEGSPTIVIAKNDDAEKANIEAVKAQWEAFAKEDLKAVEGTFTDDVVESDQADPADNVGKKAVLDSAKRFLGAFSDLKNECEYLAAGEYVVSTCKVSATNDGDMPAMGLKKTGKTVNLNVVEVAKLAEGKVSNVWRFYNGMAMAQQLGLIPEAPAADTATAEAPAEGDKANVKPAAVKAE